MTSGQAKRARYIPAEFRVHGDPAELDASFNELGIG